TRDARRVPQHNRGEQDADGPGRTPQRQGTPTAQQPSFVTPAQVDDFDDGENDYFGEMEDDPNDNDSQTRQNGKATIIHQLETALKRVAPAMVTVVMVVFTK
ncbi:unnamed protein product, partial [Aphanomyces euteiches]